MQRALVASLWGLLSFCIAGSSLLWAQAPVKNRITQAVDNSQRIVLRGNISPRARAGVDRGLVDRNLKISGASLAFRLSAGQQADLDALLARQQDPSSPDYHRWLTPEQYGVRFGMSDDDLAKVKSWLQSQGLSVTRTSRGRTQIFFSGTAAQIEAAFRTEIHNYVKDGETNFANATEPSIPAALANVVMGVRNLDNFRPKPRIRRADPRFTSGISGNTFLAPDDFATIYNVQPLYDAGLDGSGESIAVVGQTAISLSDTQAFRTASNLPTNNPQLVLVPGSGTSTTCTDDLVESNLDVQWAGAIAKKAQILFVYVGVDSGKTCATTSYSVWDSLQYAVDQNLAPVISASYGYCESGLGTSNVNIIRSWAQQANTQGQTITAASGDSGAADCDANYPATQGLAVDVPASLPEVTGLGGTAFSGDVSSPGTYWNTTNNANSGSAISYIPETSWNDTSSANGLSSGGGGASSIYNKPSWQTGTGVPGDNHRYVPDVALNSSPSHDGYLICSQGSCVNGYRDTDTSLNVVGGTSAASPAFAGIVAILNQATQSNGLGNINPTLYSLASSSTAVFHDITTGDNKVACGSGSTDCPTSAPLTIGYSAGVGYDQVTGLGSVDAYNLAINWPGYNPAPSFTLPSTSRLTVSQGSSTTSTITLSSFNGYSGTVDLSCSLSSSTAFLACSMSPASVSLSGTTTTASSTLTLRTSVASAISNPSARLHGQGWLGLGGGVLFAGVFLLAAPVRKYRTGLLGLLVFGMLAVGIACGGGSSGGGSSSHSTPKGTYTVTVTAHDGSTTKTEAITLTVN
ncbi:MAG: S8/S53 family peptidase [Acidobacteria bacterium]|nr:S8/S53 family peptidase [Acidobacteriota bacterium]